MCGNGVTGPLEVAAGVVVASDGRVLIARRPEHAHQGGRWEFPGGKREPGEALAVTLARELHEELGITPEVYRPLIRVVHEYPDRTVALSAWRVDAWGGGAPHGREGQAVAWVAPEDLQRYAFPAANRPLVSAARLPATCLVTPPPDAGTGAFLADLEASLEAGIRLVQLRAPRLSGARYRALAERVRAACHARGARLLLNAPPEWVPGLGADGVHLSAARLMAARARPLDARYWVSAAVHGTQELAQAQRIGADFALASPVSETASHPGAPLLGWEGLAALTGMARIPVYALGGLSPGELPEAWGHGAQGVAAIRGLWAGPTG